MALMTSQELNEMMACAIRERHDKNWTVWFEVRLGTGFGGTSEQRIDAFAMHNWPSEHFERVAYEIKISRSDFLRELRKPKKRRPALRYSNYFYFVTSPGVARVDEIPIDCGLIEADENGQRVILPAPYRDSIPPTWRFVAGILRRALEIQTAAKELPCSS